MGWWTRVRDWLVLIVLVVASMVVMLTQNRGLVQSLRATSLEATSLVESWFTGVGALLRAPREAALLRADNIELASEVARAREAQLENERLRQLLGFTAVVPDSLLPARVVSRDQANQGRLLTLNVGREDGVEPGMAVLTDQGIVGRVVLVSARYARVMPYLNTDFRVPARIQPLQAQGIVRWEGQDPTRLLMEHVVKTEPVQAGQRVVTSGTSLVFPAGYPVGEVDSVIVRPGRNELVIHLTPASPLLRVDHVFVVLSRPDPELEALVDTPIR
ncbi:MAG: rod shape-determining protein MreC [Bacteroidota bacterium]